MSEKKFRQLRISKVNNMPATIKRIFFFMFKYKIKTVIILLCIVIAALTNVASSYFITPVIDEYVVPFIGMENVDLSNFAKMLVILALIYLSGTIACYLWRKLMSL